MTRAPDAWWRRLLGGHRGAATPDGALAIGGRFALRTMLGHGSTGTVFLADDRRSGNPVALKLIRLPAGLDAQQLEDWRVAFARESMASARLRHPDIVALLDAGIVAEGGWLALEYVPGSDLSRYTGRKRLLPEALALRLGARVARALAHAHRAGIVHRDLKPSNVRVDLPRGVMKLTDFGIARILDATQTRTGLTLGTPAYMAPELLAGEAAGAGADTWALGVLLYELLAGRRPSEANSLGELLRAMAQDSAPSLGTLRPDLPIEVDASIAAALQRDPQRRPRDLEAWAEELERLAQRIAAAPAA